MCDENRSRALERLWGLKPVGKAARQTGSVGRPSRAAELLAEGKILPRPDRIVSMSEFAVEGQFQSRDGYQSYQKTIQAPNADVARDRLYSQIGSQHGLKRTQIEIDDVSEEAAA